MDPDTVAENRIENLNQIVSGGGAGAKLRLVTAGSNNKINESEEPDFPQLDFPLELELLLNFRDAAAREDSDLDQHSTQL